MSMHRIPLTELERAGLINHGLATGKPSQLSDVFRHGMKWALDNVKAVPQWIPVNDPPKEIGRYWCYVEEQNDLGVSHYQWNCSWNGDEWSGECLTGVVTHWMPLPAAPVKDGE